MFVRATDLPSTKNHTVRVNAANLRSLQSKPDIYARFGKAYRDTVDWMYSSEEALEIYAEFANVSVDVARQIRMEFDPKEMVQPDQIVGMNDLMAEAIKFKYISRPLTESELKELVQIR